MLRRPLFLLGCGGGAALVLSAAALADSDHDIHFTAEHVPESGMDAHYAALPWPTGWLKPGEWQTSVDLSIAHTRTDFVELDGPMVAFAAASGVSERWGYELLGFYSDMEVSGGDGRAVLAPDFLQAVPLRLPALADFTNPRGTMRHFGIGAAAVFERRPEGGAYSAQLIAGALLERIDMAGFEMDYRVLEGADAGATGILEHSSHASFVTPFVAWQQTHRLSLRWAWSPRAQLAYPLPPGDFAGRLTGSGFDLATPRDGAPLPLGDPYVTLGLAFVNTRSGLEIDLGGMLFFAVAEHVSHAGVDRALLLHLAWHRHVR